MDKAELLATFTDRVDQFEKFQSYIAKARDQSSKFASAVVDKVIKDNHAKAMEVAEQIAPLVAEVHEVLEDVSRARGEAVDSSRESQFRLEELDLRLAIGDLTQEAHDKESVPDRAVVKSADARVKELDEEKESFEAVLRHWSELQGADDSNGLGEADDEPEVDVTGATPLHQPRISTRTGEAVLVESDVVYDPSGLPGDGHRSADGLGSDGHRSADGRGRAGHRAADGLGSDPRDAVVELAEADAEVDVVFEENNPGDGFEVDDLDLLGDDAEIELEDGRQQNDKPRRAVLLYQEGTAEEQIYPFTAEVLSLGRGRDNDVQVKNDSKVSRYHCKLYRRGPNFYIEDNKSANGTLVNGELITERRLFGGEEVIIGETFFRFRILD